MGLAYQAEIPVNWCPALEHRALERGGQGRQVRRDRRPGRAPPDEAVDAPHHEVRGAARAGPRGPRLARARQEDAARLDRPLRGRRDPVRRPWPATDLSFQAFTTRPDTLFGATFCVLAPEHPLVAKITTRRQARGGRGLRAARGEDERPRARRRRREGEHGRVHRGVRGEPARAHAPPDLDRRLRARGLRHRRDHVRSRPRRARLRVRAEVRPAGARRGAPCGRRCRSDRRCSRTSATASRSNRAASPGCRPPSASKR